MKQPAPLQLYTLDEAAARFRCSRRKFIETIKKHPFYSLHGTTKLFSEADLHAIHKALPCPSNSNAGKAARTGTSAARSAGSWSAKLQALTTEKPPKQSARSASGRSSAARFSVHQQSATFAQAAVSFIEAGGEARFLGRIGDAIGDVPLARVDQALIDKTARELYPDAAPGTIVRQAYAPIIAVCNHGAKQGLCERKLIERPKLPPGRVRWITFAEAELLLDACAPHLRPLVMFMLGTGARVSEALYLDWQQLDLARRQVSFFWRRRTTATAACRCTAAWSTSCADRTIAKAWFSAPTTARRMRSRRRQVAARSKPPSSAHAAALRSKTSGRTTAGTHGPAGTTPRTATWRR
jgi:hypothetical protein